MKEVHEARVQFSNKTLIVPNASHVNEKWSVLEFMLLVLFCVETWAFFCINGCVNFRKNKFTCICISTCTCIVRDCASCRHAYLKAVTSHWGTCGTSPNDVD